MLDTDSNHEFVAYEILPPGTMVLSAAPVGRSWMDATQERFAYRCLPMLMANQLGWLVGSACSFSARWNGGPLPGDTALCFDSDRHSELVSSLFGHGIITFNMPCVFRTPPGVNLLVRGPANNPKDGISPLEGLVEADWSSTTFTMNCKITRPRQIVRFEAGEAIAALLPFPRGFLESLQPIACPISESPAVNSAFLEWSQHRDAFQARMRAGEVTAVTRGWQKEYFQGTENGANRFPQHQTTLALREFSVKSSPT